MARHNDIGKWGENLVCEKLVAEGYAILERNWHLGHYELDVIAIKDNRIIFGEVKTRTDYECDPLEAIDSRKISRMVSAANAYIRYYNISHEPQFDVFGIAGTPEHYRLEHVPDAFYPPLKSYR